MIKRLELLYVESLAVVMIMAVTYRAATPSGFYFSRDFILWLILSVATRINGLAKVWVRIKVITNFKVGDLK